MFTALIYHSKPFNINFSVKKLQNDEVIFPPKIVRALWSKLASKKVSICGRIQEPIGLQSYIIFQKMPL